jgi:hypothetical protein
MPAAAFFPERQSVRRTVIISQEVINDMKKQPPQPGWWSLFF